MGHVTLTYQDIAVRQLDHALDLYLKRGDLVCALTLAGAAEEILGCLAAAAGKEPSLKRLALRKRTLFRAVFPKHRDPGNKVFVDLNNKSRNMMKHLLIDPIPHIDLDFEAGKLLKRAVENYDLVVGPKTQKMRQFEGERIRRATTHAA